MFQNFKDIFFDLSTYKLIVLALFSLLFAIRFIYQFLFTGRVLFRKKLKQKVPEENPLSLILTVRNEELNLKQNLPKILALENVNFEMVVVDDFSQDNSYQILGLLKDRYKRLTISTLNQETRYSTKMAQNIAIKAAQNDWILTFPVSMSELNTIWLDEISKEIENEKNIIVAFSSVVGSKGLLNYLYRIENYFQFLKSTAYILNGIPFVYTEENLAFRKQNYFELGGYGKKINETYANLELLINSFIRKNTTSVLLKKESVVRKTEEIEKENYFDLLKKSIRIEKHLSVSKRFILGFDEISKLLFLPVAVLVILLIPEFWALIVGLLGIQFVAHLLIIKITQNRLNERKIFIPSLVYEFVMPHFKLFFRWHFNRRNTKNRWKNKV